MALAGLEGQELKGLTKIQLTLAGKAGNPVVTGSARVEGGSYENMRTGTLLKDLEIEITAKDRQLSVRRFSASDGEKGRVTAQGRIELDMDKGLPFNLDLGFDQTKLLRQDNYRASAGGSLTLSGSIREMSLVGELQIPEAEIRIPERLPPDIAELEVIEVNRPGEVAETISKPPSSGLHHLKLNVTVKSPGKIFVGGRGLESEWKGDLAVRGPATNPTVSGRLSVLRGHLNFLGKRFALKKGQILFDGAVPPSPRIDATAEAKAKDIKALVHLSGPVSAPKVKLSSDPVLPADEVLAHLLFGRNLSSITPLQALQIADALNTLSGGRGLDVSGRARRMLGVDQLEVKSSGDKDSETRISAGKHLGDNLYLEVEKGVGSEPGTASVEVEITPNISVETELGEDAEAGVGVKWKWDY
jgi:translocation and assembly module TamB